MSEEARPVSEELLEMLEDPSREIRSDIVVRVVRGLTSTALPEGLEELAREMFQLWERIVELFVVERLTLFVRGERGVCSRVGMDSEVCTFVKRLVEGLRALLLGLVIVDDAGRVYVRLRISREINGRVLPRGAIISLDPGVALLLYAMGECELATIKPLKG
ncbi:hypothetical protein Pyrfu_0184 [Pyrolobus fumarii 1A]|uniref:Uncharacterized protein n=1 Tax=Pyrolobus fumarii (strain DSM 11204 / 1A) TaxID=694429 RepID=G0EEU2_PYRF1|nr:hypothetical protein [Pyrolobus fumarii]AEM38056.1 hypothetical protein Pyrfu_0184 [Pyrolobus fumarii 1A]